MKKVYAVAAAILFIITSCSSDSNPGDGTVNVVLLKKTIEQPQSGPMLVSLYQYDGTKLESISRSDGHSMNFTYTGDQITKVEYFENSVAAQTTNFTYDADGRVAEMFESGNNTIPGEEGEEPVIVPWANRTMYTYNPDSTISFVTYTGDHESQTEVTDEGTLTVANGNVTAYTSASGNSTYTFDANSNPEMNITGINPVNLIWQHGIVNNITAANYTNGGSSYTTTYTYNSNSYPQTATRAEGSVTTNIWYLY